MAACEVICFAWYTLFCTKEKSRNYIIDVNEIPGGNSAVFQWKGFLVERLVDKRGRHIPPHSRRGSPPLPRTQNLAGSVHILKTGSNGRKPVLPVEVDRIEFSTSLEIE